MRDPLSQRDTHGIRGWLPPTSISAFKQEMHGLLEGIFGDSLPVWRGDGGCRLDVVETVDAVEVSADLPGFHPDDVSIDLVENHLTITANRHEELDSSDAEKKVHRHERKRQAFARSVWLPCPVDQEKISAELTNGVLKVRLPKVEGAKRRKIPVTGTPPSP